MAANERPDTQTAMLELMSLRPFVGELDDEIERLRERNAAFPSEFIEHQIDRLIDEQNTIIGRMLELETQIFPPVL